MPFLVEVQPKQNLFPRHTDESKYRKHRENGWRGLCGKESVVSQVLPVVADFPLSQARAITKGHKVGLKFRAHGTVPQIAPSTYSNAMVLREKFSMVPEIVAPISLPSP